MAFQIIDSSLLDCLTAEEAQEYAACKQEARRLVVERSFVRAQIRNHMNTCVPGNPWLIEARARVSTMEERIHELDGRCIQIAARGHMRTIKPAS